jgi:peroxiredoxin Q/BCP
MPVSLDQPIPDLPLLLTGNTQAQLSHYRGQHLVLYFYPKASTTGCTTEGLDFTAAAEAFAAANTRILGASRDGLKAQENFKAKQGFSFDLISDKEEQLCQAFDVIKLKKLYGKESLGIERSTFLIDADGVLRREWRKVKVKGHVEDVLTAAQSLNS